MTFVPDSLVLFLSPARGGGWLWWSGRTRSWRLLGPDGPEGPEGLRGLLALRPVAHVVVLPAPEPGTRDVRPEPGVRSVETFRAELEALERG